MRDLELATAFSHAKPFLAKTLDDVRIDCKDIGICRALDQAVASGDITELVAYRAKKLMYARMSGHASVAAWLFSRNILPRPASLAEQASDFNLIQEFRHGWVDELIHEFRGRP